METKLYTCGNQSCVQFHDTYLTTQSQIFCKARWRESSRVGWAYVSIQFLLMSERSLSLKRAVTLSWLLKEPVVVDTAHYPCRSPRPPYWSCVPLLALACCFSQCSAPSSSPHSHRAPKATFPVEAENQKSQEVEDTFGRCSEVMDKYGNTQAGLPYLRSG